MGGSSDRSILTEMAVLMYCFSILFSLDVAGELAPDFDLEVDTTYVTLNESTGNRDFLSVILTSHCAHILHLETRVDGNGYKVDPNESTIILESHGNATIGMIVETTSRSPYDMRTIEITSQIVRVDGVAVEDGKERHASVVVHRVRDRRVSVYDEQQVAVRGTATYGTIQIEDRANCMELISLHFDFEGEIQIYPGVDWKLMEFSGEDIHYPYIVVVPENVTGDHWMVPFSVWSETNSSKLANATLEVKLGSEPWENGPGKQSDPAFLITTSIGFFILFMILHFLSSIHPHRLSRQFSAVFRNRHVVIVFLILLVANGANISLSRSAGAQTEPDVKTEHISTVPMDSSPFSPDSVSIGAMTFTITSNESYECVVRVLIDIDLFHIGHTWEHRVPAFGVVNFTVNVGVPKWSSYQVRNGIINSRIIEIEGAEADGWEHNSGFLIYTTPFGLPTIEPEDHIMLFRERGSRIISLEVGNQGNSYDSMTLVLDDANEIREQGFNLTFPHKSRDLDSGEIEPMNFTIGSPREMDQEFQVLRMYVFSDVDHDVRSRCTIVIAQSDGREKDSEGDPLYDLLPWILMITTVALVVIVRMFGRHGKRSDVPLSLSEELSPQRSSQIFPPGDTSQALEEVQQQPDFLSFRPPSSSSPPPPPDDESI